MSSTYVYPNITSTQKRLLNNIETEGLNTPSLSCQDIAFNNSTIVNSVTSTGEYLTLTVNGKPRAIPLFLY